MLDVIRRRMKADALVIRHRLAGGDSHGRKTVARCNDDKKIIFTVNAGRSGSEKLTQLFGCLEDVDAQHEPRPSFHRYMRASQGRPEVARAFLLHQKIPSILASARPIYFESSHLFSKGFFEEAIQSSLRFALVHLHRAPAKIARSLHRLNVIPGRTRSGLTFLAAPFDDVFLGLPGWPQMSDYQLCYWYALEMEERASAYRDVGSRLGLQTTFIATDDLSQPGVFENLCGHLGVAISPHAADRLDSIRHMRVNEKSALNGRSTPIDADDQERRVQASILRRVPAAFAALSAHAAPSGSG